MSGQQDWGAEIVRFEEASARVRSERELREEGASLAAAHGNNVYTDFLCRNGRRPEKIEAAVIGRLLGARVLASDGTLQPPRSKGERAARRLQSVTEKAEEHRLEKILTLRSTLTQLAQDDSDPCLLVKYVDPAFDDVPLVRQQLAYAVEWMTRFAQELDVASRSLTPDLFAGYAIDRIVVMRVEEPGRGIVEKNRPTAALTLAEAKDYLAQHSHARKASAKKVAEWRKLIRRITPYMTLPDMTIGDGLRAAEAAEAIESAKKPS